MAELDDKVRKFLEEKRFAVVATAGKDGMPRQTVMWYELQGDRIMMNTAVGRLKEKNLARDPRVSFCVEDEYKYVTITGRAAELDYDTERSQADIRALAIRYHGQEKSEEMSRDLFSKQARVTFYMTIEDVDTHL
ncbi:MAG TPA: PPOX class F420-dependent oxidoreductase [Chloroflexia bacterium]|nr:PPOX class F420-dependent oxidoreductase [Chloroflexia bacterium]